MKKTTVISIDCSGRLPHDGIYNPVEVKNNKIIEIELTEAILHLSDKQQNGSWKDGSYWQEAKTITYQDTRKEMSLNQNTLNVIARDYFINHQEVIPENWNNKNIIFWGSIFERHNDKDDWYVEAMFFHSEDRKWKPMKRKYYNACGDRDFAIMLKS